MLPKSEIDAAERICEDLAKQDRRGLINSTPLPPMLDQMLFAANNNPCDEILRLRVNIEAACYYLRQGGPGRALEILEAALERPPRPQ